MANPRIQFIANNVGEPSYMLNADANLVADERIISIIAKIDNELQAVYDNIEKLINHKKLYVISNPLTHDENANLLKKFKNDIRINDFSSYDLLHMHFSELKKIQEKYLNSDKANNVFIVLMDLTIKRYHLVELLTQDKNPKIIYDNLNALDEKKNTIETSYQSLFSCFAEFEATYEQLNETQKEVSILQKNPNIQARIELNKKNISAFESLKNQIQNHDFNYLSDIANNLTESKNSLLDRKTKLENKILKLESEIINFTNQNTFSDDKLLSALRKKLANYQLEYNTLNAEIREHNLTIKQWKDAKILALNSFIIHQIGPIYSDLEKLQNENKSIWSATNDTEKAIHKKFVITEIGLNRQIKNCLSLITNLNVLFAMDKISKYNISEEIVKQFEIHVPTSENITQCMEHVKPLQESMEYIKILKEKFHDRYKTLYQNLESINNEITDYINPINTMDDYIPLWNRLKKEADLIKKSHDHAKLAIGWLETKKTDLENREAYKNSSLFLEFQNHEANRCYFASLETPDRNADKEMIDTFFCQLSNDIIGTSSAHTIDNLNVNFNKLDDSITATENKVKIYFLKNQIATFTHEIATRETILNNDPKIQEEERKAFAKIFRQAKKLIQQSPTLQDRESLRLNKSCIQRRIHGFDNFLIALETKKEEVVFFPEQVFPEPEPTISAASKIAETKSTSSQMPSQDGFFKRHWKKMATFAGIFSIAGTGAGIGAAVGLLGVPFTFGISLLICAGIGFGAGLVFGACTGIGAGVVSDRMNRDSVPTVKAEPVIEEAQEPKQKPYTPIVYRKTLKENQQVPSPKIKYRDKNAPAKNVKKEIAEGQKLIASGKGNKAKPNIFGFWNRTTANDPAFTSSAEIKPKQGNNGMPS